MDLEIAPNLISTSTAQNLTPLFNIGHVDFSQSSTNAPHAFITTDNDLSISSEIYLTTENEDLPLNIISLRDNQIVKIEYQNEAGIMNTEYIMNDHLMTTQFVENVRASSSTERQKKIAENASAKRSDDSLNNNNNVNITTNNSAITNILNNSLPSPETDDDPPCETDLTSLNWLHNITNIMAVPNIPTPPISPPPNNKRTSNNSKATNCQEDLTININFYKKNGDKKPPFSYATLICMAMSKNGNKMTLSAIYNWIRENFLYYKKAHPSWQVIRLQFFTGLPLHPAQFSTAFSAPTEFNPAQLEPQQVLRESGAVQGRARERGLLEAGSRAPGGV